MKKTSLILMAALLTLTLVSCKDKDRVGFDPDREIMVISREDGSGTRGAFIELFGIEQKDSSGQKIDRTTIDADITNSTSVMLTSVAGDPYAIGYISLGSMNDTVKALQIDGVSASVAAIKSGEYRIARPFNIIAGSGNKAAQDFIEFILSADGQKVVEDNGYIPVSDSAAYSGEMLEGKIVISGSSSVTPVMEKLKEAYLTVNPNVTIEIQQSDSTTGIQGVTEGICDIGMASRALKESEFSAGLEPMTIAMDGIAVIVNRDNPVDSIESEKVASIFMGQATRWSDVMS